MKIGIDTRLQNETGIGRYIRNLVHQVKQIDRTNEYIEIHPPVPWHSVEEQLKLPGIIDAHHVDLMHFPYFAMPVLYTKPFVVTIHDLIINYHPTGKASTHNPVMYYLKRFGYLQIMHHAVTKSRAIIVPSESTKELLLTTYRIPDTKVFVTPEGVDREIRDRELEISNETFQQLNSEQFFLYVGNAYPHKNVEMLVKSFATLDSPEKLVLVGKMNYFYYRILDLVKSLKLEDRVVLTGEVSDAFLSWLYTHARATVVPSKMEGFGLPVLEAMSAGCPVIASDIPAFREVGKDALLYFNVESPTELASMLRKLTQKDASLNILEKIKKGKDYASKYSWKKMAKETINIYNSCIT